jgi:hypothetical protein
MRNGTVVEGLNANCAGAAVNNHRCVTVELLTGETISIPIEVCKMNLEFAIRVETKEQVSH